MSLQSIRTQALSGALLLAVLVAGSRLIPFVAATQVLPAPPTTLTQRVAERLHARLMLRDGMAPTVSQLVPAVRKRQKLLASPFSITVVSLTGALTVWDASLAHHPQWIRYRITPLSVDTVVDQAAIQASLAAWQVPGTYPSVDMDIQEVKQDGPVLRANTSQSAGDGVGVDATAAERMARALEHGTPLSLSLQRVPAIIRNHTAYDLDYLTVLAVGRSNFKGSDNGRIANVKKALTKHVHDVVVPAGAAFSFNDTIKDSGGWELAKVIVKGTLELGPGGGICQASTTVFRGMLQAGLPILQHRSHSMYVVYYEKYGVGLDATVFPGSQDLRFLNDTGHPLLLQTVINGWEAEVRILGVPDGRKVTLNGPYFSGNAPGSFHVNGRPLRSNEILWQRSVDYPDGRTAHDDVLAQYQSLPRSVVAKYQPEVVHAAGY